MTSVLVCDMPEGQGFSITTDNAGAIEVITVPAGTGPVPVTSVFGRTGAIVAQLGDYNAGKITNDSGVTGATVKDALNTLNASLAPVSSVFGRTGAVVAAAGDYNSTQVNNSSGVPGATCTDALNNLGSAISSLDSSDVANASGVAGATVTNALNSLAGTIAAGVLSVFGRVGAVVATAGDYNSTQVNNSSGVAGATVTAALNTLAAAILALVTGVSSVFGRAGAVVATLGDYTSSLITNSSGVAGATVTAALNTLNTLAGVNIKEWRFGATNAANNVGNRYLTAPPGTAASSTLAAAQLVVVVAQTVTSIRVSSALATTTTATQFTFQVNGVDSTITVSLAIGATSAVATGFSVALVPGDRVSIKMVQAVAEAGSNAGLAATVW